ncbi:uncharacterized protein LOC112189022 [Rosa chinensis]|uniref:uncharacterized protein LOC112189022 n=1 Tax=Rosa chinensis TaxID=74649 RepID=UPI001AD8FE5C|nr:uncharacterized protein LOC112189022 [Rosa chinensis]
MVTQLFSSFSSITQSFSSPCLCYSTVQLEVGVASQSRSEKKEQEGKKQVPDFQVQLDVGFASQSRSEKKKQEEKKLILDLQVLLFYAKVFIIQSLVFWLANFQFEASARYHIWLGTIMLFIADSHKEAQKQKQKAKQ